MTLNLTDLVRPGVDLTKIIRPSAVNKLIDGVFEGGGALGTAYSGSLRFLHDNRIWFARVAGTSAGAITAAMIAVGYTAPEIQWLTSAYSPRPPIPDTLTAVGITEPVPFKRFLDLPSLRSVKESKRKTLLWKALKGRIIDEIGQIKLPIPTQSEILKGILDGFSSIPIIGGAIEESTAVKDVINTVLTPLPDRPLRIEDFLPDLERERIQFADTMWDIIAEAFPIEILLTNLIYEGSLFEGDEFLKTIRGYFGKKQGKQFVYFKDLKIPLALVASNIQTGNIEVYSSATHPDMEVAEAVRRSMSIPFVFQPRGNNGQLVDGGLLSNFPLWLLTEGGRNYWPAASVDNSRPKIGFCLDDTQNPRSDWNVGPARYPVPDGQINVEDWKVIIPVMRDKLSELHTREALVNAEDIQEMAIFKEIAGVYRMNAQKATRNVITKGLAAGLTYYDIVIPLRGYHWLDFDVNKFEPALHAMWDRAWHITKESLSNSSTPLVSSADTQRSPYARRQRNESYRIEKTLAARDVEQLKAILNVFDQSTIEAVLEELGLADGEHRAELMTQSETALGDQSMEHRISDEPAETAEPRPIKRNITDFPPNFRGTKSAPGVLGHVEYKTLSRKERLIGEAEFLPVHFLEEGVQVQRAVARLQIGNDFGSGFLVSDSLLMTNNHVLPNKEAAKWAKLEFNYQLNFDGVAQEVDVYAADPDSFFYTNPALDYTIVRVKPRLLSSSEALHINLFGSFEESSIGALEQASSAQSVAVTDPTGASPASLYENGNEGIQHVGKKWGYIPLKYHSIAVEQRCNIIQHAAGRRKEIAIHDNRITNVFSNGIQYRTDTESGSSGSPIFDNSWDLIAIHYAAGEWDNDSREWLNNEGMRIDRIIQDLRQQLENTEDHGILNEIGIV